MGISELPSIMLSGNFPEEITFQGNSSLVSIYMNDVLLLEEVYEPSDDFIITLKLRDLFHSVLENKIPVAENVLVQDKACANFRIDIPIQDGIESHSFRLVKGGIDSNSVSTDNFLQRNFLTWMPQVKKVKYLDPQWLTYYNIADARLCIKATWLEDDELITSPVKVMDELPNDSKCTINVKFQRLWEQFQAPGRSPYYIDCFMTDEALDALSYVQRFVLTDDYFEFDDLFAFENSLGGIDVIRFTGELESSLEHEFKNAVFGNESKDFDVIINRIFSKDTGYFRNNFELLWTADFMSSTNRFQFVQDIPVRIILKSFEAKSIKTELNHYSFIYSFSKQSPFLNNAGFDNNLPGMMSEFSGMPLVWDDIYVRVFGDQTIDGTKTFLDPVKTDEIKPATGTSLILNNLVVAEGGIIDCGQF